MIYDVSIDGRSFRLELERTEERWICSLDGRAIEIDAVLARPDVLSLPHALDFREQIRRDDRRLLALELNPIDH